ncbi:MAG: efflux RND transporter periplasmic adaptor subunit, partial [Muribaculaceae bacterium]|nr:efflux RND transporter periplasmic adaptor subunit [Muribaculaceae bacterium]
MDREIPKHERIKATRTKLLKWGAVAAAVAIAGIAAITCVQSGVKRSSLTIGVAERGNLETSVAGNGRVVPAFEQIINSPISSRI